MRVISGSRKGRKIQAPPGHGTRPPLDRLRESIFNIISDRVPGSRFLDLFAGSGSMGIEALSRGAVRSVFVEYEKSVRDVIDKNLEDLALRRSSAVLSGDLTKGFPKDAESEGPYDLVFMDPPFPWLSSEVHQRALRNRLGELNLWTTDDCLVMIHGPKKTERPYGPGWHLVDTREYGRHTIWFYEKHPEGAQRNADWWNEIWQAEQFNWDLGQPSPPIVRAITELNPTPGLAFVPGCGRGHEALWLAGQGWRVVAADFAPDATPNFLQLAESKDISSGSWGSPEEIHPPEPGTAWVVQANVLDPIPALEGTVDLIVEHTCYCAIDPRDRESYIERMASLLKPDGHLVALFYQTGTPGGPPFGTEEDEIRERFSSRFNIQTLEIAPDSIEHRVGRELLGILTPI